MSINVKLDYIKKDMKADFEKYKSTVKEIHKMIENKTGQGSDYLGWVNYAYTYDKEEVVRIVKKANYIQENFDYLVVIGIGGSYLGARAGIDALNGKFPTNRTQIVYLGNTIDPNYTADTLNYLKDKNYAICVISKSGTTLEPSIAFRLLRQDLEKKLGKEKAKDAIVAITDKEKGALRKLVNKEGYESFILPEDIGGRFSVITPVGLFPMACAGIDILSLLEGLKEETDLLKNDDLEKNPAYQYACERNYLYQKGYMVEMFVTYEPRLRIFNEWLKQLFDESEGKNNKGLLTTSVNFTTDLHSLGQFIQDGSKVLYETVLYIDTPRKDVVVPYDEENCDGLNYVANKKMSYVNRQAYLATLDAHANKAGVPCIQINLDKLDAKELGKLFYFYMKTCAMSGYMLGINPFNQPGVEVYKKNMFHLLGREGY